MTLLIAREDLIGLVALKLQILNRDLLNLRPGMNEFDRSEEKGKTLKKIVRRCLLPLFRLFAVFLHEVHIINV